MVKPMQMLRPNYDVFFGGTSESESSPKQRPRESPAFKYPLYDESLKNEELPLISADLVKQQDGKGSKRLSLGIVIDGIVYDCTEFKNKHPGGRAVLMNLAGNECSWQFWKLHSPRHLKASGHSLRVGQTKGITNPFQEPKEVVKVRDFGVRVEPWRDA